MIKISLILTCLALQLTSMAQTADYIIHRTTDFEISGEGTSKNWAKAPWLNITQTTRGDSEYQTRARVLYSDLGLYFVIECEDNKLSASMIGYMEDLWNEDVAEVFLWTDENYPLYFEYEISALNQELVLLVPNFDGDFLGWIPWHYDEEERKIKHLTSVKGGPAEPGASIDSWTAEFFIPFELLTPLKNVPPISGTEWRMNIYRMDYDTGERLRWEWKPVEKNFHEFEKFGRITFE